MCSFAFVKDYGQFKGINVGFKGIRLYTSPKKLFMIERFIKFIDCHGFNTDSS